MSDFNALMKAIVALMAMLIAMMPAYQGTPASDTDATTIPVGSETALPTPPRTELPVGQPEVAAPPAQQLPPPQLPQPAPQDQGEDGGEDDGTAEEGGADGGNADMAPPAPTAPDPAAPAPAAPAPTTPADPTTPAGPAAATDRPFIAYSSDSYFRTPLPAETPVSSTSAEGVSYAKASNSKDYPTIRGVGGNPWGIAYAMGTCSDPIWKVSGSNSNVPASQRHLIEVGFHAPADWSAKIPDNGDAPFVIIDRCGTSARPGGLTVWGANATVDGLMLTSGAGDGPLTVGSFAHDTNGLDRRNPKSNSDLNERSRGVIPDAMVIRDDLLNYAIENNTDLGHVLHMFWHVPDSSAGVVHPMVGYEKPRTGYGAEGERMRVKPSLDLDARAGCGDVAKALAKTLQNYGAYIGDTSGGNSGVKAEQGSTYPGLAEDVLSGCITWDDFEFLPRDYEP